MIDRQVVPEGLRVARWGRLVSVTAVAVAGGLVATAVTGWLFMRDQWHCVRGVDGVVPGLGCAPTYDGGFDGLGELFVAVGVGHLAFAVLLVLAAGVGFARMPTSSRLWAASVLRWPAIACFACPAAGLLPIGFLMGSSSGGLLSVWLVPLTVGAAGVLSWRLPRRRPLRDRTAVLARVCAVSALLMTVQGLPWILLTPAMVALAAFPVAAALLAGRRR